MPIQYASIVEEHRATRSSAGLFDIGHMGRLAFRGEPSNILALLESVTTNRVAALAPGRIQYSLMTNARGGVIDDVLVYRGVASDPGPGIAPGDALTVVCNAGNRPAVLAHLAPRAEALGVDVVDRTFDTAMIAVQGPKAADLVASRFSDPGALSATRNYAGLVGEFAGIGVEASRTGYTGEDGFELIARAEDAEALWNALIEAGESRGVAVAPCGLGARDTLRLEAAMPLHGHEISEEINPYSAGLGWAVKLDKGEFVGREALAALRENPGPRRVGLALEGKRVPRENHPILDSAEPGGSVIGRITSGTFSPTLECPIALGLVEAPDDRREPGTILGVDVRGRLEPARVVSLPFHKRPKS